MPELTPDEIFRKDQALAKKIADEILGEAPAIEDVPAPAVSPESDIKNDTQSFVMPEDSAQDKSEDPQKKPVFKRYANVEEAVKDARQRLPRIKVVGEGEDIAFKELSGSSDAKPAPFVKRGVENEVEDIWVPSASAKVSFGEVTLGESDELVTDVEHDEKGRRIQHGEEEGDVKPYPYQTRTDAAYKAGLKVAQKEINATERAAGGLSPEEDAGTVPPTVTPEPLDVSSTPEALAPETKPADWILERMLNEIPDGSKFVLRSPTGKTHSEYHREGNVILSSKDGVVTENVLARLNKGWTLEIKTTEAPKTENNDLLKGRDPKDYSTVFPGDVWVLRTENGQILDKLTVNYTLQYGPDIGEIIQASSTWEKEQPAKETMEKIPGFYPKGLEWRKKAFGEKLEGEGYVLEVAGEKPKIQSQQAETIDHQKETDPYSRINGGDIWELRSPTGKKLERIYVEEVFEKKTRGRREIFVEIELESERGTKEEWQKLPLENFHNKLTGEGYVLISRGSGAELDNGGHHVISEKELEKTQDLLGLPKNEEEWVRYETAGGEIGVNYDSAKKLYTITHVVDEKIIGTYSEGNIRRLAELEEWKKIGEEQVELELQSQESPKKAEQTPKESLIDLPEGGNELFYRANNGSEFKVRKSPVQEGLFILVALSTLQEREINEAELQDLARKNAWEQFEKGPEPLVGPEPFNDQLIEKARTVVEEARGDFVRVEAEQTGALDRLKKYFSFLRKQDEINPEVRECWERYENALVALQSLEIEKIKRSGLKDKELKQSIAGMIREYDFEEAERIDNDKRTLRLKEQKPLLEKVKTLWESTLHNKFDGENPGGKKWRDWAMVMIGGTAIAGEAIYRGTREVGVGYNKIVSTKGGKYTMMAAGGAAFGTALIFSGGAAASMAGVLLAAKRAAAGAGFAVAAEGLADKGAQALRSRKTNKKAGEFLGKAKDDEIETMLEHGLKAVNPDSERDLLLERLEEYLKKDVNKEAYSKSVKRELNHQYRKTGAVIAGVLFGNSSFIGNIFSEAQAAVPEGSGEQMANGAVGETPASVVPSPAQSLTGSPEVRGRTSEVLPLLQERIVSAGDTITTYAVTSGKSLGLEGEEGERFAALLREKLNEKLTGMDPDTARVAGFVPNKDGVLSADFIRAGEKLNLGKILSAEEMKALVEQAKETITAPVTPAVEVQVPASRAVLDATVKVLQEAGIAPATTPTVTEVVPPTAPDTIAEFGASKQKVTEYIQNLPQAEQVEVFRTMRGTMRDIFNTPEISIYGNYDMNYDLKEHPELAKATMGRVLEDHKTLSSRAFYMYDRSLNPLHWTQMQELAKFTEGAAKVLGKEVAMPLKRESIEEYILRMALIAKESNKSFPGLHMVK